MENFTITNPIIPIEFEEQRELINKLYPNICRPSSTSHVLIEHKFTLEELANLKAKLDRADSFVQEGEFIAAQISFAHLNRAQAIYLKNRSTQNEIYSEICGDVTSTIDDKIQCSDINGPWWGEVNEVLSQEQISDLYDALYKLK